MYRESCCIKDLADSSVSLCHIMQAQYARKLLKDRLRKQLRAHNSNSGGTLSYSGSNHTGNSDSISTSNSNGKSEQSMSSSGRMQMHPDNSSMLDRLTKALAAVPKDHPALLMHQVHTYIEHSIHNTLATTSASTDAAVT